MQKIIVQKFGGTSLNNKENRIKVVDHIINCQKKGYEPVVIVSAPGRMGEPYSTDTLSSLIKEISSEHIPREHDLLLSCGEIISACLLVYSLWDKGIKATALTGAQAGIVTDGNYCNSRIIHVDTEGLKKLVSENIIPVIAGYQGVSISGEVTTLGRGGSDISAAVVAAALKADSLVIFSDIDGVMTADPKIVPDPGLIKEMDYQDLFELTIQGAKVIHPRAAEIARNAGIPIKVKSTFTGQQKTTVFSVKTDRPIIGIVNRNNIGYVKITSDDPESYEKSLTAFGYLSEQKISVDFIDIRPETVTFVVDHDDIRRTSNILINNCIGNQISEDFCMISIVGAGMTGLPGIMSKIVETMQNCKICIYQTTDSHSSISILIKKDNEIKAVNALHIAFNL